MIGVDTNVLVRYLVRDDPVQMALADRFFQHAEEEEELLFLSDVVFVELVWVLQQGYRVGRDDVAATIERLLRTEQLVFDERDVIWRALAAYRRSKADFADCLIAALGREAGCRTTVTLDRRAAETEGMEMLD